MRRPFVVIRTRGPAWDDSQPLETQAEWPAHAAFMDAMVAEGFVLLGGPLEGTRDAILVIRAVDAGEITNRLASDPWTLNGLLVTGKECRPWQVRLGSLAPTDGLPTYRVLTGPDDAAFCRRVSEAIAQGYKLYGPPAVSFNGAQVIVAQAIIWPSIQEAIAESGE